MPNAGGMRDRCLFQSEAFEPDGAGGGVSSWVNQCTVWGRLVINTGSESMDAGRLEATASGVLHVRKSPDTDLIQPSWRVVIDGVPYAIISPPQDRMRDHKWLQMGVRRGGPI